MSLTFESGTFLTDLGVLKDCLPVENLPVLEQALCNMSNLYSNEIEEVSEKFMLY